MRERSRKGLRTPFRMRIQTSETSATTSRPKAHDVVHDVTNQEAPPDDESKDGGQGSARQGGLVCARPPPANPIGRQQSQPDGDEILLEIQEAQGLPVTTAL